MQEQDQDQMQMQRLCSFAQVPPGERDEDGLEGRLGDPDVDICPPSLQAPRFLATVARVPLRPVAFAPPGELAAWVAEDGPPLVYLTMGTAFGNPRVMTRAIARRSSGWPR